MRPMTDAVLARVSPRRYASGERRLDGPGERSREQVEPRDQSLARLRRVRRSRRSAVSRLPALITCADASHHRSTRERRASPSAGRALVSGSSAEVGARRSVAAAARWSGWRKEPGPVTQPIEMASGDTPVPGHARRRSTGRRPLPSSVGRDRRGGARQGLPCGHAKTRLGETVTEKLGVRAGELRGHRNGAREVCVPVLPRGVVAAPPAGGDREGSSPVKGSSRPSSSPSRSIISRCIGSSRSSRGQNHLSGSKLCD